MKCIRCGKEMESITGGNYHCPSCDMTVNDLVYRLSEWKPFPQGFGEQKGWICPVCGQGVAPWVDVCPCQKYSNSTVITCGSTMSINNTGESQFAVTSDNSEWNKYVTYTEGKI